VRLSSLEIFYSSTTLPQMMARFVAGHSAISAYHIASTVSCTFCNTEDLLLGITFYDQYWAVCHPLFSTRHMNLDMCLQRTPAPLLGVFLSSTVIISVMSQVQFRGPSGVDHFFCEFTPLLELSHSDTKTLLLFHNLLFRDHPPLLGCMVILCA